MAGETTQQNANGPDEVWAILERILRPKFRFTSGKSEDDDYLDAVTNAFAKVQRRLEDPDAEPVKDLESFAATIAFNEFRRFLRKKYPRRWRLATDLMSTLDFDPRLAHWLIRRTAIGGKAAWTGQSPRLDSRGQLALSKPEEAIKQCFAHREPATLLLSDLLLNFFEWLRTPFDFDHIVHFCFKALGLRETEVSEIDPEGPEPVDTRQRADGLPSAIGLAKAAWAALLPLDARRRGIYLLFEPAGEHSVSIGDQLLSLGVVNMIGLAEAVGLTLDQFLNFRLHPRATYELVGELYGISAKDVENIRRGVTERVERHLRNEGFRREQ